jgi:predicted permease
MLKHTRWFTTLLQDVRYGVRSLSRSPLLACAALLTLALGIGLNVGVFTVINALLFRAHVDKEPDTFVRLYALYSDRFAQGEMSLADYRAYQSGTRSLKEIAAWDDIWTSLGGRNPARVRVLLVSCNFFSVYGLERPKFGRLLRPTECSTPGSGPVAVLSDEIWRNRFAADPHILGKLISVGRHAYSVVGVAPAHFSGRVKSDVHIWIPYTMLSQFEAPEWFTAVGRLNPNRSRAAAQAELNVIARQQDRLQPGRRTTIVVTNGSQIAEPHINSVAVWVISFVMGALTLLLLIACINVTALLLSRAAARQREIAIRLSLGAGRLRLLRMLLTEVLILATVAGACGVYLAYQVPSILIRLELTDPPVYSLKPDWTVFAYLTCITLLAGFVAGLAPAAESLRVDLSSILKGQETLFGSAVRMGRTLEFLIAGQLAMCLVLLAAAGVCIRAQYTMFKADPGFEMRKVLAVQLDIGVPPYTEDSAWSFYRTLERRVRELPGVQAVCYASVAPFERHDVADVRLPGQTKGTGRLVSVNNVTANYFETLGIPIVRGRAFLEADTNSAAAASVIVVSEAFARAFWPGEDPLGKVAEVGENDWTRVVGVAHDTRSERYGAVDGPQFYRLQNPSAFGGPMMVRFRGDSQPVGRGIREIIRSMDPEEIAAPATLESAMDEMAARFLVIGEMIMFLGAVAVVLAMIGIYGVVAFAMSRRTRELGIRMALGATTGDIIGFVFRSGVRAVVGGLLTGLVLALELSHVVAQLMKKAPFAVNTGDPIAFVAVSALLVSAAVAAMFGPALRAARSDPMNALRQE